MEMLVKAKEGTDVYEDLEALRFDPALRPGPGVDKEKAKRNRTAIRTALASALTNFGIAAEIDGAGYGTWYVKEEGSLSEVADARGGGYCKFGSQTPRHNDHLTDTNMSMNRGY